MKKKTLIFLITSSISYAQKDTTFIIERENIPLQAVLDIDSYRTLFVGQEYRINFTTSGNYPIKIKTTNAYVEFLESSKKGTGGLKYKLTPKDTGECKIAIYNVINENRTVNLSLNTYKVIKCPKPNVYFNEFSSGNTINKIDNEIKLFCSYPKEFGVFVNYEIMSWEITINDKKFEGKGDVLTEAVKEYLQNNDNFFMQIQVSLKENSSGHKTSESIFIIKKEI